MSRAQTTATAKRAAERLVLAGMRRPPPALQRGEGRAPRDVLLIGEPASSQAGDGAAATATSSDDAPCPPGRAALPRVAVRSPRAERYTLPCRRERGKRGGCHGVVTAVAGARSTPPRSAPGPHGMGSQQARADTSGHGPYPRSRASKPTTSGCKVRRGGVRPLTSTAAAGLRPLPTKQVVAGGRASPCMRADTGAGRSEPRSSSRAMPAACP
jgi:hypothetical protein